MKPIKSFREYVEKLEESGEIVKISKEVDSRRCDPDTGFRKNLCSVERNRRGNAFRSLSWRRSCHCHDRRLSSSFRNERRRDDGRLVRRAG